MKLNEADLRGIALRLILGLPVLIWLAGKLGRYYGEFWLPVYQTGLGALMPGYRILGLAILNTHGDTMISGGFQPERLLLVNGQLIHPETVVSVSMLLADALKHPIILGLAVLVWPGLNLRQRAERLLISLPFIALLELTDIPLTLASLAYDAIARSVSSEGDPTALLVHWSKFLDGGGRIALSIAAAVTIAWLHERLRGKPGGQ